MVILRGVLFLLALGLERALPTFLCHIININI